MTDPYPKGHRQVEEATTNVLDLVAYVYWLEGFKRRTNFGPAPDQRNIAAYIVQSQIPEQVTIQLFWDSPN